MKRSPTNRVCLRVFSGCFKSRHCHQRADVKASHIPFPSSVIQWMQKKVNPSVSPGCHQEWYPARILCIKTRFYTWGNRLTEGSTIADLRGGVSFYSASSIDLQSTVKSPDRRIAE